MAGARCSVRASHNHVRVDYGLSLIERDITAHPDNFVLTDDRNLLVHFTLGVEPSHRSTIQCSDSSAMSTRNLILFRELHQSGKSLVSLVENDRILFRRFSWVQQLNLHTGSFASRNGFRRRNIFAHRLLRISDHGCDPDQYQNTKKVSHRHVLLITSNKCAPVFSDISANARRFPFHRKPRKLHILRGMTWLDDGRWFWEHFDEMSRSRRTVGISTDFGFQPSSFPSARSRRSRRQLG